MKAANRQRSGAFEHIACAFGDRLDEVQAAMETLAATRPPQEMNRVAFWLYVCFRPDIARGAGHMVRIPMNSAGDSGVMSATHSNRSRPAIPIDVGRGGVCPWAA
jgi:hypothetical protein